MSKKEYIVGPDLDQEELAKYARLLDAAYRNGRERGAHMDWNDVGAALDQAVAALGGEALQFMKDAKSDQGLDDGVMISFAGGTVVPRSAWSAALLLAAYRFPDQVKWEDVDTAWETLHPDAAWEGLDPEPDTGPKP